MSDSTAQGTIGWTDLTVPDADGIRQFYAKVVGWESEPVSMGDYDDFSMIPAGGSSPVAGICHARGGNAGIPPVWLVYIMVESVDDSLAACTAGGGEVLLGPKGMGPGSVYAVIRDPAGAVVALWQGKS